MVWWQKATVYRAKEGYLRYLYYYYYYYYYYYLYHHINTVPTNIMATQTISSIANIKGPNGSGVVACSFGHPVHRACWFMSYCYMSFWTPCTFWTLCTWCLLVYELLLHVLLDTMYLLYTLYMVPVGLWVIVACSFGHPVHGAWWLRCCCIFFP